MAMIKVKVIASSDEVIDTDDYPENYSIEDILEEYREDAMLIIQAAYESDIATLLVENMETVDA